MTSDKILNDSVSEGIDRFADLKLNEEPYVINGIFLAFSRYVQPVVSISRACENTFAPDLVAKETVRHS